MPRRPTQHPRTPIGKLIIALRNEHGLTQEELAALSGVKAASLSQIEAGIVKHPKPSTLRPLSRVFGIPMIEFAIAMDLADPPEVSDKLVSELDRITRLPTRAQQRHALASLDGPVKEQLHKLAVAYLEAQLGELAPDQ